MRQRWKDGKLVANPQLCIKMESGLSLIQSFKFLLIPKAQGDTESGLRSSNFANKSDFEEHQEESHAQVPHQSHNQAAARNLPNRIAFLLS